MHDSETECTVRSVTDCTLYTIDRKSFMKYLMGPFQMKRQLYGKILTSLSFAIHLTAYEISLLADSVVENTYDNQQTVFSVDSPAHFFYIVTEGQFVSIDRSAQALIYRQG